MWGLLVLFAVGAWGQEEVEVTRAPPYVQSRTAFTHTRLYLQKSVPRDPNDLTDPDYRRHLAFGIMAGVTAKIALDHSQGGTAENWLTIMDNSVPLAWVHYDVVAAQTNAILSEANLKIQTITSLIDAICSTTDSVEQCNEMVHRKVKKSDQYVHNRANLLLALGVVSDTITRLESKLNTAAADFTVVPYLLNSVKTQAYEKLIRDLATVYKMLRKTVVH